jgi:hypothetical protein
MVVIVTIDDDPIVRGAEFVRTSGIGKECGVLSTATLCMEDLQPCGARGIKLQQPRRACSREEVVERCCELPERVGRPPVGAHTKLQP